MGFREISRQLWHQGLIHYDKPFGYHGIETILANPTYIGLPAWGKVGVGTYRILHGSTTTRIKRKAADNHNIRKDESQYIQPAKPLFPPIVPVDLYQRVHDRLKGRWNPTRNLGSTDSQSGYASPERQTCLSRLRPANGARQ